MLFISANMQGARTSEGFDKLLQAFPLWLETARQKKWSDAQSSARVVVAFQEVSTMPGTPVRDANYGAFEIPMRDATERRRSREDDRPNRPGMRLFYVHQTTGTKNLGVAWWPEGTLVDTQRKVVIRDIFRPRERTTKTGNTVSFRHVVGCRLPQGWWVYSVHSQSGGNPLNAAHLIDVIHRRAYDARRKNDPWIAIGDWNADPADVTDRLEKHYPDTAESVRIVQSGLVSRPQSETELDYAVAGNFGNASPIAYVGTLFNALSDHDTLFFRSLSG